MLMKDVVSSNLSVDELLDLYGASLDFPDEPEEIVFDGEDKETRKANLDYLARMFEAAGMESFLPVPEA
jgi:hypothetical protein